MIEILPPQLYRAFFYWPFFAISVLTALSYYESKSCKKLLRRYSFLPPFLFVSALAIWLGLRPVSWHFGDMPLYAHRWSIADVSYFNGNFDSQGEWFFDYVLVWSKQLVPDVQFWFLVVELFYMGFQLWACKRLLWENTWLAVMFVFFSYQFFTFGTNGIRNGMACAIMMVVISFVCNRNTLGYVTAFLLFILALGCHRSVLIPLSALIISLFVIKDIKYAIYVWLACIVLSFFGGGSFLSFFSSLGYDERMSSYATASEKTMSTFSHSGFRWDFLLYSAMPVWLAWYVRYKGIIDKTFYLLANTYIIANSFWVLVCRVAYSNRFAYLSWFMYALVIAYAVVRVPIWQDQDRKAGQILIAHSAFTIIMFVLGK